MMVVGIVVTLLGFLVAVASVGITSSVGGRMGLVLAGMAICLVGIIGVLNRHFVGKAIWRK
jgi:hypothetical protein